MRRQHALTVACFKGHNSSHSKALLTSPSYTAGDWVGIYGKVATIRQGFCKGTGA